MKWLPEAGPDFREHLAAALQAASDGERLNRLSQLARTQLSHLQIIQLDSALSKIVTSEGFERVKLALLGSATMDHLAPALRIAGLRWGVRFEVYVAPYGQYRQELHHPDGALSRFAPDNIVLQLSAKELVGAIPLASSKIVADDAVATVCRDVSGLWGLARERFGATVIQQSVLDLNASLFGNHDAIVEGAPRRLVSRVNAALQDACAEAGVLWLDIERAAAQDGLDRWFDPLRWLQAKMEISPNAAARFGELVARLVAAQRGKSKKCLVLDLDNTLWGGVIGDDGVDGIKLGEGSGVGEAHLALQRYAKKLSERGVLLAVCSKNDAAIAEAAFRHHPEMALARDDFAAFYANWDDKASNLQAIARDLNIGLDSLVFVDDNPAERARVRGALPTVAVPELPADPAHYVRTLSDGGYFESIALTQEDIDRSSHYAANRARQAVLTASNDMDAFLQQLDMTVAFGPVTPLTLTRVVQLINKTNQFNTNTARRTETEIEALAADPRALTLQLRLRDKFGDNGIVSALTLVPAQGEPEVLEIANWVMSCRVFGRNLEHETLNILVEAALAHGARRLRGAYIPTPKNGVIRDLFSTLGFELAGAHADASIWELALADYTPRQTFIKREGTAHDRT
ncbi:MAG: HAD family hydrolase [Hyphomonadaceae bacterium]|nr:HAD family hydrolase [Hyphomonadaceae bacterium]